MASKNKETFASRARKITKQYTRADFDETEKAELEQRLAELAQEQEAYKEANGLNEQPQQEQMPELQQFAGPGNSWMPDYKHGTTGGLNYNFGNNSGFGGSSFGQPMQGGFGSNNMNQSTPSDWSQDWNYTGETEALEADQMYNQMNNASYNIGYDRRNKQWLDDIGNGTNFVPGNHNYVGYDGQRLGKQVSGDGMQSMSGFGAYIPSLASGAISMIGNIAGQARAREHTSDMLSELKDPAMVNAVMQNPSLLNLESERSNIRKDFDDAKGVMSRNIKNNSRGRGEYLSAVTAGSTSMDRNKAKAISQSQLNEAKYNAAARERSDSSNIANKLRADTYNSGINSDYEKLRFAIKQGGFNQAQGYRDAAWQVPGQVSKGIVSQYQQDQLISSLGQDYGYVRDPSRKWWQMPQWQSQYQGRNRQS